jgi:multiple sugar transport system substrate-binding protein
VEKKHGKVHQIGRQIAYNEDTKVWSALPAYYTNGPRL